MLQPVISTNIDNFILIKYTKHHWDIPHIKVNLESWNSHHEMMFRTMLDQLHFFYPNSTIHVLTNEKHKDEKRLVWHYRPDIEENHTTKLHLYGLLSCPAMYIDSDILLVRPFQKKHLITKHPFNLFQVSRHGSLQRLTRRYIESDPGCQYNCGLIWIPQPNSLIVEEMRDLKEKHFNDKKWIEYNRAVFNNDEHPVSCFVAKYEMKMNLSKEVNTFRSKLDYANIFDMQSIHYTGVRNKKRFVVEYRELCKARARIFS